MPTDESLIWGPSRGGGRGEWGVSALVLPENNAQIFLAHLWYFIVLPRIILTVLPKSLKVIQLLHISLKPFKAFPRPSSPPPLPPPHTHTHTTTRSQNPSQKITFWSCFTALLISGLVPKLPKYNSRQKINDYSSQLPKTLGRAPYMYMATYN